MMTRSVRSRVRWESPVWSLSAGPDVASSDDERPRCDEPAGATTDSTPSVVRWLILAALACRALVTLPTLLLTYRQITVGGGEWLLWLGVGLVMVDLALLAGTWARPGLIRSGWVLAGDVVVTVLVNVGSAAVVDPGQYFDMAHDPFTGYAWGTIGLWTIARGPWVGAAVLGAMYAGYLVCGLANGALPTDTFPEELPVRMLMAAIVFVNSTGVQAIVRQEARRIAATSERAARMKTRADAMRAVHDGALAELEAIVKLTSRPTVPDSSLQTIHDMAAARAEMLRTAPLGELGDTDGLPLDRALRLLAARFAGRGLIVAYDCSVQADVGPDDPATPAIAGAALEALNNVAKHSGVSAATVTSMIRDGVVQVEVHDRGAGLPSQDPSSGTGIRMSIVDRLTAVGGGVSVESAPGVGTTVVMWAPLRAAAVAERSDVPQAAARIPIVVLAWRILVLPAIAAVELRYMTPAGTGWLVAVLVSLGVLNVWQLRGAWTGTRTALGSRLEGVADLAGAVALHGVVVAHLPPGSAHLIGPDFTWTYLAATVGVWMCARSITAGIAVLAGAVTLMAVGTVVNEVPVDGGLVIALINWAAMGAALLAGYAFLLRMTRRAERAAAAEADQAGQQQERIGRLAWLQGELLTTMDAIRDLSSEPEPGPPTRLRGLAIAQSNHVRALLDLDRPSRDTDLRIAVGRLIADISSRGRHVDLQDAELVGTPPKNVIDAAVAALRLTLGRLREETTPGAIVVWLRGDRSRLHVRVRHHHAETLAGVLDDITTVLCSAGVEADVWSAPGRGVRVELRWEDA